MDLGKRKCKKLEIKLIRILVDSLDLNKDQRYCWKNCYQIIFFFVFLYLLNVDFLLIKASFCLYLSLPIQLKLKINKFNFF